jgi:energy-coupling factor transporter ATP-binding protein EcfA2
VNAQTAVKKIDALIQRSQGRHLSEPEVEVILAAWNSVTYENASKSCKFSENYLKRNIGPKLWRVLQSTLGEEYQISKDNFRFIFENYLFKGTCIEFSGPTIIGQLPNTGFFYGRESELADLNLYVNQCRCVALTGVAGIGKSTLVARLVENLRKDEKEDWKVIVWKPVFSNLSPPWLSDLVASVTNVSEHEIPKSIEEQLSALIRALHDRRCLLILDEMHIPGDKNLGLIDTSLKFDLYKQFLIRLTAENHSSCLVITSREPMLEIIQLQNSGRPARIMQIQGLKPAEAIKIFEARNLKGRSKWEQLIHVYRGNPMVLQTVAMRIEYLFGGDVEKFMQYQTTLGDPVFQAMLDVLFGQPGYLNNIEREIMIYLALVPRTHNDNQSSSFENLVTNLPKRLGIAISTSQLIQALENLEKRSLIESHVARVTVEREFELQPLIRKYIQDDPSGFISQKKLPA